MPSALGLPGCTPQAGMVLRKPHAPAHHLPDPKWRALLTLSIWLHPYMGLFGAPGWEGHRGFFMAQGQGQVPKAPAQA